MADWLGIAATPIASTPVSGAVTIAVPAPPAVVDISKWLGIAASPIASAPIASAPVSGISITYISLNIIATEPVDTADALAAVQWSIALSTTEANDNANFVSNAVQPGFVLNGTEAQDTASGSVSVIVSSSLAATESNDIVLFSAGIVGSLSLVATESADTSNIIAFRPAVASLAATEASDSFSGEANNGQTAFWTDAWAEAQASVPANMVELYTIELLHPSFLDSLGNPTSVRAVRDTQDHVLTLESSAPLGAGTAVTFTAIPFEIPWPEIAEGQVPELTIRIDNIGREIVPYLDAAVEVQAPITVIFRVYIYDTSAGTKAAGITPIKFPLRSVTVTESYVEGSASPADLANLKAMRLVYDLANYPGLDIAA